MNHKNLTTDSIKQILNQSASKLDSATIESLRNARARAMDRYRAQQHAPVQAWLNHHGLWVGSPASSHKYLYWAIALLLAAYLFSCSSYWQHNNEHDHSEIDIAILTDDLPVDAYVE